MLINYNDIPQFNNYHKKMLLLQEALSKLEIMYAVLIPMHGPTKGVNIFIVYKGLAKGEGVAEIGEDVERKAVVSQVFNDNGYLSLRGKLL